jgi:3'(2'), 5'-bisphosphate nucleotidase
LGREHERLVDLARRAALAAGEIILKVYCDPIAVRAKADASPVTAADEQSEAVISAQLMAAAPDIPIIAEEHCAEHGLPERAPPRFWLVDPLDGTTEFIARNGEFCVNIGLIEQGEPVLGVVYAPVQGVLYAAAGAGTARRQRGSHAAEPIAARAAPSRGAVVVHSRSHIDEQRLAQYLATLPGAERRITGSAIKFCLLAAGEADYYPRFGRTMEWDTAAGQAILAAAGGSTMMLDDEALRYGKPGFLNADFIARGRS